MNETARLLTLAAVTQNFPLVIWLMRNPPGARDAQLRREIIMPTLQKYIDERKASLDRDNPCCLVDHILLSEEKECMSGLKMVLFLVTELTFTA